MINLPSFISALFQSIKRLFVLVYDIAANSANTEACIKDNKKYFLPIGKFENYTVLINGGNIYD